MNAGAGTRLELDEVLHLDRRWMLQPKFDGVYVTARTDETGRISSLTSRAGESLRTDAYADVTWLPLSTLIAEAELWTAASIRAVAARGFSMLHVFDASMVSGVDVSALPFSARRDSLRRAEADLADATPDRPWLADRQGKAHGPSGRYERKVPRSWRRVQVAPQVAVSQFDSAWADWVDVNSIGPVEGLVAVRTDAALGARNSKRKIKQVDTIDASVVEIGGKSCRLSVAGHVFGAAIPASLSLRVRDVVELAYEGRYDSGVPKFARILRKRRDLRLVP